MLLLLLVMLFTCLVDFYAASVASAVGAAYEANVIATIVII